jgi:hypothetical protein
MEAFCAILNHLSSAGFHWRAFLGQIKNTAQNVQKGRQQGRSE